jgi:hypothetical protein
MVRDIKECGKGRKVAEVVLGALRFASRLTWREGRAFKT